MTIPSKVDGLEPPGLKWPKVVDVSHRTSYLASSRIANVEQDLDVGVVPTGIIPDRPRNGESVTALNASGTPKLQIGRPLVLRISLEIGGIGQNPFGPSLLSLGLP